MGILLMHEVYHITNTKTGKIYVGKSVRGMETRCKRHFADLQRERHPNSHLQAAWLLDSGSFVTGSLAVARHGVELNALEIAYIQIFQSHLPENGYNKTLGGDGAEHTPQSKAAISRAKSGLRHAEDVKERIRASLKGRKLTETHRKNVSRGRTGVVSTKRTHCRRGHLMGGDNLRVRTNGKRTRRVCRECERMSRRRE